MPSPTSAIYTVSHSKIILYSGRVSEKKDRRRGAQPNLQAKKKEEMGEGR